MAVYSSKTAAMGASLCEPRKDLPSTYKPRNQLFGAGKRKSITQEGSVVY